jgi:hypothetical protein
MTRAANLSPKQRRLLWVASHTEGDGVLPVEHHNRGAAAVLTAAGYLRRATYREFAPGVVVTDKGRALLAEMRRLDPDFWRTG